jgi:AbrB family looped-hinge helix DNA binding protein
MFEIIPYHGTVIAVPIARSKLTAKGRISVPSEVRKKLGIGPGSVLEWDQQGDEIVVRRAGGYGWHDVRKALFPEGTPKSRTLGEIKDGMKTYIRRSHKG